MTSIIELNQDTQDMLNDLYFLDESDDAEKVAFLKFCIDKNFEKCEAKINYALKMLLEAEGELAKADLFFERAKNNKKSKESAVKNLRSYIKMAMELEGLKKVKGDILTASFSEGRESVVIYDEQSLPKSCVEQIITTKPNKDMIKQMIKDGQTIEGAVLTKTPFVTIK